MTNQNIEINRTKQQNQILDLEKKYMDVIEKIILSETFIQDLKNIEAETKEYYDILSSIWGKKNKIKEASERLLRHHMYTNFSEAKNFYPSPISCDIALELDDVILNIDVKTIDKIGNPRELSSTQFEHNQTSFVNKKVFPCGNFQGFPVQSNIKSIDPRTKKPVLTYLIKIGYADNGKGVFDLINHSEFPSLVLTCLPNGVLSNLFDYDLFNNFKDYVYYKSNNGMYYKPKEITTKEEFNALDVDGKFHKIESTNSIPDYWERISINSKVGYYDAEKNQLWWTQDKKVQKHKIVQLAAVQCGNTARFNDKWLEERYDSSNNRWSGERKYFKIYQ